MNKKELQFILQEGEGLKIEFKQAFDKSVAKEMVAFANTEGGRIFLGVTDRGKIAGCKLTNRMKSQILDIANKCDPKIGVSVSGFDDITIISVNESSNKPHRCPAGFYLRQGASSQKMARDEIINFSIKTGAIRFDEQINDDFSYSKHFDEEKLNHYLVMARVSKLISNENILRELNVAKKGNGSLKFNNAGVLFFSKKPQQFIPHSVFTCVLFRDDRGTDIIDRKEVGGSLVDVVEEVMNFVNKNTRIAYK